MKLYGSLINRLEENNNYCEEIKVGTYATQYMYTDRHAYEVTEVIDQGHVFIRQLDAVRADNNGMSESQSYNYISNESNPEYELKLTKYGWKEVTTFGQWYIDRYEKRVDGWWWTDRALLERVRKAVAQGKTVKKYTTKWNISFGVADEYYDYSF